MKRQPQEAPGKAHGADPSEKERRRTRRQFISGSIKGIYVITSASAVMALLDGCGYGDDTTDSTPKGETIDVDTTLPQFSALATVGGAVSLDASALAGLPSNGVFIVRSSETAAVVLDRTCTHMGCKVGILQGSGIATCPCHGSQFNSSGAVVTGPAGRSLKRYPATVNGDIIEIEI